MKTNKYNLYRITHIREDDYGSIYEAINLGDDKEYYLSGYFVPIITQVGDILEYDEKTDNYYKLEDK